MVLKELCLLRGVSGDEGRVRLMSSTFMYMVS